MPGNTLLARSVLYIVAALAPNPDSAQGQQQTGRPEGRLEVPVRLVGPLDKTLPANGFVSHLTACADRDDALAVVWLREAEPIARVKFEPGEVLGFSVVRAGGDIRTSLISDLGHKHVLDGPGAIFYSKSGWRWVLSLTYPNLQPLGNMGIAVFPLTEGGLGEPVLAAVNELSKFISLIPRDSALDLFWLSRLDGDRPDFMGGGSIPVVKHTSMTDKSGQSPRVVYRFPNSRDEITWDPRIIRAANDRLDLIVVRRNASRSDRVLQELVHVRDFTASTRKPERIAMLHLNSTWVPLVLPNGNIHVVWLEQAPGVEDSWGPRTSRLMEASFANSRWSAPKEIGRGDGWDYRSLAADVVNSDDVSRLVAVWQGTGKHMTYAVASDELWSSPINTALPIGERKNMLCAQADWVWLITCLDRNLFCCRMPVR